MRSELTLRVQTLCGKVSFEFGVASGCTPAEAVTAAVRERETFDPREQRRRSVYVIYTIGGDLRWAQNGIIVQSPGTGNPSDFEELLEGVFRQRGVGVLPEPRDWRNVIYPNLDRIRPEFLPYASRKEVPASF